MAESITRRGFLFAAGVGVLAMNESGVAHAAPLAGKRPNIIFILTDDQGYGDIGRHGNPILKTPNLDRLHDEGVRFTDFYVSPTCAPTRCSLMTGRHEFRSGVTHTIFERERMSLDAGTFPRLLQESGYATGIFGKWHLGDEAAYQPGKRGFDEVFIHGGGGIGQTYPGTCGDAPGNNYNNPVILHNGVFEKTEGYCTDVFFRRALSWMDARRKDDTPFFTYIATNAPHDPLICPAGYEGLYAGKVNENEAKFFGMIANIDDNVGTLLTRLAEWGIERDTLVVFMTDNGGTAGVKVWNSSMRASKCTPYNGGTRAACFMRWPGTLAPGERSNLTAHLDIFPTLTEIAGVEVPESARAKLDGFSLTGLLSNVDAPWPDRMLFTHVGRWPAGDDISRHKYTACAVHWRRYHLVSADYDMVPPSDAVPRKPGAQWTLYDLSADPGETTDLFASSPDIVGVMEKAYDAWWDSVQVGLVNEKAMAAAPKMNPFHELYWRQYGGTGPNNVPLPEGWV